MRELTRPAVWSNLFYLIPLVTALLFHFVVMAFLVALVMLFSVGFHATDERDFVISDWLAAALVILANVIFWYRGGMRPLYSLFIVLLAAAALLIRYHFEHGNRGGAAHALWHTVSAIVTTICIVSYGLA